jgi:nucleoside 2-deoxyribosyltransferase
MNNKIQAYVSHPIRGKKGDKATNEDIKTNIERAIVFGNFLKTTFPNVDFYVPGEHDEFVLIAYRNGYITEKQILDVDCKIISQCNFVVVFMPEHGEFYGGVKVEVDYATKHNIPVIAIIDGEPDEYATKMVQAINKHLLSMTR